MRQDYFSGVGFSFGFPYNAGRSPGFSQGAGTEEGQGNKKGQGEKRPGDFLLIHFKALQASRISA
jgi:hypothetical protein